MLPLKNNSTHESTFTQGYVRKQYTRSTQFSTFIFTTMHSSSVTTRQYYCTSSTFEFSSQTNRCSLDLASPSTASTVRYMYKRVFRHVSTTSPNRNNRSAHLVCEAPILASVNHDGGYDQRLRSKRNVDVFSVLEYHIH